MSYIPTRINKHLGGALRRPLLGIRSLVRKEYLLLVLATASWAINHSINKIILRELTPLHILAARNWIGFAALFLATIVSGRASSVSRIKGTVWLQILGLACLGYLMTGFPSLNALRLIPASVNGLLQNTSPIFLALASPLLLRETVSLRAALGTVVAFMGVFLIVFGNSSLAGFPPLNLIGVSLSLTASVSWAACTLGGRRIMPHQEASTMVMVMTFFAGCILAPIVLVTDGFEPIWRASLTTKLLLAFEGSVVTGLSQTSWYYALKRLEATKVAVFQYLVPVFAVLFANLLLAEPITVPLVIGLIAIIAGIRLVQETGPAATTRETKAVAR